MIVRGTTGTQTVIWLLVVIFRLAKVPVVREICRRSRLQATALGLLSLGLKTTVACELSLPLMRWLM